MPTAYCAAEAAMIGHLAGHAESSTHEAMASHLTSMLRANARAAGWGSLASGLSVSHDGSVDIHHSVNDKVMDLEYGDGKTPPAAVIRRFQNRAYIHADEVTAQTFLKAFETVM